MAKYPKVTKDDIDTFREAAKGTRPLKHDRERMRPASPKPTPRIRRSVEEADNLTLDESADLEPVGRDQHLSFHRPGLHHKTLRKLRKGQYTIEAVLDLHGMTVSDAEHAIVAFLAQCISDGIRLVLVIHGKGRQDKQPLLKNKLNHWLRQANQVLAFCSANPFHGGSGALYVLLKRGKEETSVE